MVEVFDWQRINDPREAIDRAVQALRTGQLVGVPTETVYGVAADAQSAEAVERLAHCKGRPDDKPFTVALKSVVDLPHWVWPIDAFGRRLSRRGWPGPLTIVFTEGLVGGQLERLPQGVRQRVSPEGSLGLRIPDHEAVRAILFQLGGPLVLTSANLSGQPDAVAGGEVARALGKRLSVLIDDGATRYGNASSVVRIRDGRWELLREGALRAQRLEKLANCVILFVCTGNTCRSPLSEGICKKLLAERIGCCPEELPRRGFSVRSAGISALAGCAASPEAVVTARTLGINLDGHVSQPVHHEDIAHADVIFAMTRSHMEMLATAFGLVDDRVQLLSPNGNDISDPIGCDASVYDRCAKEIQECLERRLEELVGHS